MKYISAGISLGIVIIAPILFMILLRKKAKIGIKDVVIGILTCFFFKLLCNNALLYAIAKVPGMKEFVSNDISTSLMSALASIVCVVLWLWIVYRLIYDKSFSKKQISGFTAGAAMIEIYYTLLNPALSNFVFFYETGNGTLEEALSQVYDASQTTSIISSFQSYPTAYYLYFGAMTIMVIANTYLLGTMLLRLSRKSSKTDIYVIGFIIAAYAGFYYFASPISLPITALLVLFLAVIQFWFAKRSMYNSLQL